VYARAPLLVTVRPWLVPAAWSAGVCRTYLAPRATWPGHAV